MTTSTTFPLLALTVMLWILWSDSIRPTRPSRIVYAIRAVLFLAMTGVLIFNMFRYSSLFSSSSRILVALASLVGVIGAGYFVRKMKGSSPARRPAKTTGASGSGL